MSKAGALSKKELAEAGRRKVGRSDMAHASSRKFSGGLQGSHVQQWPLYMMYLVCEPAA
jgi:hypothetical protein